LLRSLFNPAFDITVGPVPATAFFDSYIDYLVGGFTIGFIGPFRKFSFTIGFGPII
jgi:hypothetical protein